MNKQKSYNLAEKLLKENNFFVVYNLQSKAPYTIKETRALIKPNEISLLKTKAVKKFVPEVKDEIYYLNHNDVSLLHKYISKNTEILYKISNSTNTKKLTEFVSVNSIIYSLIRSPVNRLYNYIKQLKNK